MGSACDSLCWGNDCLWLSCILWKKQRASVLRVSFDICKHLFFLNVFKVFSKILVSYTKLYDA